MTETCTEKTTIDALKIATAKINTSMRVIRWVVGIGVPLFLVLAGWSAMGAQEAKREVNSKRTESAIIKTKIEYIESSVKRIEDKLDHKTP